jgi:magnesium transporter
VLRILTWGPGGLVAVPPETLPELLAKGTHAWIDITGPDDAEALLMREQLCLHPLAIEDTRNQRQRPKVEEYPEHLFLILNPVEGGEDDTDFRELDVFLTSNLVVTVHPAAEPVVGIVEQRAGRRDPTKLTPGDLVYLLLDTVVDSYFPVLDEVADHIEQLEDLVLENPDEEALNRLFTYKRQLVMLRKVVAPQRDVMTLLARHDLPYLDQSKLGLHLRDVLDHLLRIADMVDTYRDLLSSGIDLYMSAVSNRLNRVVNRLTVVTVMVGAMAVITGFYGMNFEHTWPPFDAWWGVPFTVVLMAAVVAAIIALLRKLRWV